MNKTILAISIVLVIAAGAYYLVSRSSSPAQSAPAPISAAQSANAVSIKNFSFTPATLTVKVGTTVTWVNDDSAAHTVTSDSGGLLHSETIAPGQSFSFTFTDTGSVSYHCAIHPSMRGTVVVEK